MWPILFSLPVTVIFHMFSVFCYFAAGTQYLPRILWNVLVPSPAGHVKIITVPVKMNKHGVTQNMWPEWTVFIMCFVTCCVLRAAGKNTVCWLGAGLHQGRGQRDLLSSQNVSFLLKCCIHWPFCVWHEEWNCTCHSLQTSAAWGGTDTTHTLNTWTGKKQTLAVHTFTFTFTLTLYLVKESLHGFWALLHLRSHHPLPGPSLCGPAAAEVKHQPGDRCCQGLKPFVLSGPTE